MPKYKQSTAKAKAKRLTKVYIESGCNQTKLAKRLGVTRQSINDRIHQPAVQETLIELLNKVGATDQYLAKKHFDQLEAKKVISVISVIHGNDPTVKEQVAHSTTRDFIDVDDHQTQLRALELAYKVKGVIGNGSNEGVHIANIFFGYRNARPAHTAIQKGRGRPAKPDSAKDA